jgi:hypothetical protein
LNLEFRCEWNPDLFDLGLSEQVLFGPALFGPALFEESLSQPAAWLYPPVEWLNWRVE